MIVFPKSRAVSIASGSISIALGLAALVWPTVTAEVIALLVGLFLLAEALFSLLTHDRRAVFTWAAVVQAVFGVLVAAFLVVMPGVAVRLLVVMLAVGIVIRAGFQLWAAYNARDVAGVPLYVGVFGGISLLVGVLLIVRPDAGLIAFSWLIGIYAIVSGLIVLTWSVRRSV